MIVKLHNKILYALAGLQVTNTWIFQALMGALQRWK